ncbi:MAG: site-specific integrase [Chloroflexi bacterium]|nr:MAG: site-specific integrase [Chloroflexota bacterium]
MIICSVEKRLFLGIACLHFRSRSYHFIWNGFWGAGHKVSGVSDRSVRMIHTVLHRSLSQAVQYGLLLKNPATGVNLPKRQWKEMKFYDEGQVQRLLKSAREHQPRYLALFKLAITTGMRQGELLGLKWVDLDWNRQTLHVRRQLKRRKGGGFRFASPKTNAGVRKLALGADTIQLLRVHQKLIREDKSKAGSKWKENDMMFPSLVGTPTQPDKIINRFKRIASKAGLPEIRFHDLRHTAASLMLNNNIPLLVVSRRLGHSKPSVTLDVYGHLISNMQEDVADLMDKITEIKIGSNC